MNHLLNYFSDVFSNLPLKIRFLVVAVPVATIVFMIYNNLKRKNYRDILENEIKDFSNEESISRKTELKGDDLKTNSTSKSVINSEKKEKSKLIAEYKHEFEESKSKNYIKLIVFIVLVNLVGFFYLLFRLNDFFVSFIFLIVGFILLFLFSYGVIKIIEFFTGSIFHYKFSFYIKLFTNKIEIYTDKNDYLFTINSSEIETIRFYPEYEKNSYGIEYLKSNNALIIVNTDSISTFELNFPDSNERAKFSISQLLTFNESLTGNNSNTFKHILISFAKENNIRIINDYK